MSAASLDEGSNTWPTIPAALGFVLLVATLILYYVYNRLIGIDNLKLG